MNTEDILCAEALDMPTDKMYDAVFSNSVFFYFDNEEYAERVLEKMYKKAGSVIGLIDIHDIDKKEDFVTYRRKVVEDYDGRFTEAVLHSPFQSVFHGKNNLHSLIPVYRNMY